jgi:hypothetical protein
VKFFKSLIVTLTLCISIFSSDFGVKGQLTSSRGLGVGGGAGILSLIDITRLFKFYPSFDFWYNRSGSSQYWGDNNWVYENWYHIFELAFNVDAAFLLPVRPLQPYFGFGLAPIITTESWGPYNESTDVNTGFNAFGGILFPIGYSTTGMVEFRGKFGKPYNVFKIGLGLFFKPHYYHHHHYHHYYAGRLLE